MVGHVSGYVGRLSHPACGVNLITKIFEDEVLHLLRVIFNVE